MSEQPLIIGIRHHSPACAALVRESILAVRPRYVLIEGPADFNSRIESLFLPHQLPVAIYSYSQSTNDTSPGRGAWLRECGFLRLTRAIAPAGDQRRG
ncbi:DUF5682 family protein, partial [Klebsiella aerogenes]|uniref:DUF5682 family protein n=1 Tax=Klebsiella aerogenes TaxID=548 RepID=UPI000A6E6A35